MVAHNKLITNKKLDDKKLDLKDKRLKIAYAKDIARQIFKVATDDPLKSEPAQEQKNDPAQWNTSSEIVLSTSDKKSARNKISKFRSKLKKLENSIRSALVDPVLYEILKDTAGEQLQSLLNSIKLKVNESTPWQKHLIAEIKSSAEYNEDSSVYEAALD